MAMVKRIGHVAFKVTDMERSLAFYCGVLGCKRAFSMDRDGEPWIEYVALADGVFIELFYGGTPRTEDNSDEHLTGYLHACFEVEDIFAVTEQIKKNGGTMFKEPMKGVDNNYQAWIIDPDGNRIEFMQLEPDSPHRRFRFSE
ncbi:MAG: VOC family protein [Oscillospiraceae bacterium]|jgi:catechol 2,3-dioxygenase-like lactoylglutathione lyase family enzyme